VSFDIILSRDIYHQKCVSQRYVYSPNSVFHM